MLTVGTLLFLLFTNTVSSSALEDDINLKTVTFESYRHNHPPSFEPYNIPDSNEFEIRKSRNIEISNSQADTILESTSSSSSTKPHMEPVNLRSGSKTQVSNANNKIKRRKQMRNQTPSGEADGAVQQALPYLDETKESVSIKHVSTSPTPRTVVPKTFTKRPLQDNPVPKKTREHSPVVKILEETNYVFAHNGNFHYSFEGADGTKVSSVGELKSFNDDRTGEAVAGEVHYKDNEGNDFNLSYTADENGYRPYGAHLPTPPPIPPAIARALKYLATKSTPQPITEANNFYNY